MEEVVRDFYPTSRYFNAEVYKWAKFGFVIELPSQGRDGLLISESVFVLLEKLSSFRGSKFLEMSLSVISKTGCSL